MKVLLPDSLPLDPPLPEGVGMAWQDLVVAEAVLGRHADVRSS